MTARSDKGIVRILEKLDSKLTAGHYYEAHQLYRTLYFRYSTQGKYPEILQLLYKGSKTLLKHDQMNSGGDLANLLVEVLKEIKMSPTDEWIMKIVEIFALMKDNFPEKDSFLLNSVKWSMDGGNRGSPLLHQKIAEIYWKEKNYNMAHKHFLHSGNGAVYAAMLLELQTTMPSKHELELTIAQAVLLFLARNNLTTARQTLNEYAKVHPEIKCDKPPYKLALLNFLSLLMDALEAKDLEQFNLLKVAYEADLKQDPNYAIYLETIGKVWFNITPECKNTNRMSKSMLANLIGSLMREPGPVEEEEYEEDGDEYILANSSVPDLD